MPSVVVVSAEPPDERGGGGGLRLVQLLPALAAAFDVEIVTTGFRPDGVVPEGVVVRSVAVDAPPAPGRLRRRVADVRAALADPDPDDVRTARPLLAAMEVALAARTSADVVLLAQTQLAPLRSRAPHLAGARWVCQVENVVSARVAQQRAVTRTRRERWLLSRDEAKARRLEAGLGAAFDLVVTVSEEDRARLDVTGPVVPNGVDVRFVPTPLPAEPLILFSGTLSYLPNVDAAVFAADEVLPRVRAVVPGARLRIVGRDPVPQVRALADRAGVELFADVASIDPHLSAARVALVPLRIGTGTRLKALEAMGAGRPLVGTSIGLEGLGLVDGVSASIADDPVGLATAVARLLSDDAAAESQVAAALPLAVRWPDIADAFAKQLLTLL